MFATRPGLTHTRLVSQKGTALSELENYCVSLPNAHTFFVLIDKALGCTFLKFQKLKQSTSYSFFDFFFLQKCYKSTYRKLLNFINQRYQLPAQFHQCKKILVYTPHFDGTTLQCINFCNTF